MWSSFSLLFLGLACPVSRFLINIPGRVAESSAVIFNVHFQTRHGTRRLAKETVEGTDI